LTYSVILWLTRGRPQLLQPVCGNQVLSETHFHGGSVDAPQRVLRGGHVVREMEFALVQPHILLVQDLHSEQVAHTRHKLFSFWPCYVSKGTFSFSTSGPLTSTTSTCMLWVLMGKGANYTPQQLKATALVTGVQFRLSSGFLTRSSP